MTGRLCRILLLATCFLMVTVCGCGGGSSPAPPPPLISVTISPTSGGVQVGKTLQFSATISGTSNEAVSWEVNGAVGGAASSGTISTSGLYTAPPAVPSPNTVTVTAISSADSTKSASAIVTITLPPVSITVSPTTASVVTTHNQQFAAAVLNTTNTAVNWQVNGVAGGTASSGTISTSGLYTAPSSVPNPDTVTVTAISSVDSTKSASAIVTITSPPVSVTVSPMTASIVTLHGQQFAATVLNSTNTAVVWSVNGTTGGSADVGIISTSGLYTAPSAVPSSPVVTVAATSAADTTKSAIAQVTIQPPPLPTGTWSSIGPAGITDSMNMVGDPNNSQIMYAAPSHGGLYKTINLGQSWSLLPTASTELASNPVVAPASGTLYVLLQNSYQISTDGGKTFSASAKYPGNLDSETNGGFTFAVDPKNDEIIYILTPTSLLRSSDGGATWSSLTAPTSPLLVTDFDFPVLQTLSVSTGDSSTLLCASAAGFEISKDGGTTWKLQNTGLDPNFMSLHQVSQDAVNPNRLLAVGWYSSPGGNSPGAYFYSSTDRGATWMHIATFSPDDIFTPGQTGPNLYVSAGPLFESADGGSTWKNISPSNDPSGYISTISPLSPSVIAYEGANDLFVSQNSGATWKIGETGLNARLIGEVAYAGPTGPLYAVVSGDASTLMWHASNPGQAWTRIIDAYSDIPVVQFDADPKSPLDLLGVEQEPGTAATSELSSDGGVTWTSIPYADGMNDHGFLPYSYSGVHFGAPGSNEVYACGEFGIARLSLSTNTWTIVNNGIPTGAACTAMGVDQLTSGTLYAGTSSGVYKTTDGGNSWTLLFTDSGSYVSIIIDPTNSQNVFLSAAFGASGSSMRSTDAGNSWVQMRVEGQVAIHPTSPNILYAIGPNSLAASYDSGLTWAVTTSPYNYQQDLTVTPSGVVVISTFGSSVVAFTPN